MGKVFGVQKKIEKEIFLQLESLEKNLGIIPKLKRNLENILKKSKKNSKKFFKKN